jgi:hypothetical protein
MRITSLGAILLVAGCTPAVLPPAVPDAAMGYLSYGRVDEQARRAPTACDAPMPAGPRMSQSRDLETHGRKLYYLYAKDRTAYLQACDVVQPLGQVIVKQSWHPAEGSTFLKPVTGAPAPLFLMVKTGEPDSDEGWIYATATPDGKTITGWGKMASCMECHQQAKHGRLFGLTSCAAAK